MSAKGLPPAVRLDPLLPPSLANPSPCCPYYSQEQQPDHTKPFRPPPPSYAVSESPTSMSKTPQISNNQVTHAQKPRGLTPIIITPSSSRAHTPVQLLPLPPALVLPNPSTSAKPRVKKIKIETKVEPVDLEPLLPTKREKTPGAVVVIDDEEVERLERSQVRRSRNDEETNRQLPTPHATPLAQALDTTDSHSHNRCSERPEGNTVVLVPFELDHVRPISLDSDHRLRADMCCPGRESNQEKERDVDRGRKRERGPSRFRTNEKERHRPGPYDPRCRPSGQKENRTPRAYSGKLNLGQIAAAAALVMGETDQGNPNTSGSRGSSSASSIPSSSTTTDSTTCPSSTSANLPDQQTNMPTPNPPSSHYRTICPSQRQPLPSSTCGQGCCGDSRQPSYAIHDEANELTNLRNEELHVQLVHERALLQEHLMRERERIHSDIQREREVLTKAKVEVQQEKEQDALNALQCGRGR
ncbi:hypothetical protein AN958_00516 [Leucoagaricus sp. SymC.cos]|nr:hypothetical protein AN958_00516 [Leucoagaricus sp. SymC.cos]